MLEWFVWGRRRLFASNPKFEWRFEYDFDGVVYIEFDAMFIIQNCSGKRLPARGFPFHVKALL